MLRLDFNLVFTVLNILIWYVLIRKFLFKPINDIISKREDAINSRYEEAKKPGTVVVALIPARTDTRFFHDYIYHKAEIRFIKGRLKFGGCKDAAPFPSMVVIFGKEKEHEETEHAGSRGTGKEEA